MLGENNIFAPLACDAAAKLRERGGGLCSGHMISEPGFNTSLRIFHISFLGRGGIGWSSPSFYATLLG